VGAILIAAGVSIAINKEARLSALVIAVLFLLCAIFLHFPHFSAVLHNGNDRTRAFEPLALSGAALALAALLPTEGSGAGTSCRYDDKLILFGRLLFGPSMVIFGIQHFMYAQFLATLVMKWLPGHLFWIYFTGASMVAAGLAITTTVQARIAGIMLGVMFLLWVLLLHALRVLANLHNQDELTSLFVALAFSGSAFIFAAAIPGCIPTTER
jgi:uncharacterized membrane protein YphA (DoxX/SURF4 family)